MRDLTCTTMDGLTAKSLRFSVWTLWKTSGIYMKSCAADPSATNFVDLNSSLSFRIHGTPPSDASLLLKPRFMIRHVHLLYPLVHSGQRRTQASLHLTHVLYQVGVQWNTGFGVILIQGTHCMDTNCLIMHRHLDYNFRGQHP